VTLSLRDLAPARTVSLVTFDNQGDPAMEGRALAIANNDPRVPGLDASRGKYSAVAWDSASHQARDGSRRQPLPATVGFDKGARDSLDKRKAQHWDYLRSQSYQWKDLVRSGGDRRFLTRIFPSPAPGAEAHGDSRFGCGPIPSGRTDKLGKHRVVFNRASFSTQSPRF